MAWVFHFLGLATVFFSGWAEWPCGSPFYSRSDVEMAAR
jgi:hypothetical protein